MTEIHHLTQENFESSVDGKLALLDFYAEWCGPCKVLARTLQNLAKELPESVLVGKIEISESPDLAAKFGVTSIPSIVILKNGVNVYQKNGSHEKHELAALIEQFQ